MFATHSIPEEPSYATTEEHYAERRQTINKRVLSGDGTEALLGLARQAQNTLSQHFGIPDEPMLSFEIEVQHVWYIVIRAARACVTLDDEEKVMTFVRDARNTGTLSRRMPNGSPHARQDAATRDGLIWRDLPFLAPSIRIALLDLENLSEVETAKLHAFAARLTTTGTSDMSLSAATLFGETLEHPRRLMGTDNPVGEPGEKPISASLAPLMAWLRIGDQCLLDFVHRNRSFDTDGSIWNLAGVGPLAIREGVQDDARSSLSRWQFWRARVQWVGESARERGLESVVSAAHEILQMMPDLAGHAG